MDHAGSNPVEDATQIHCIISRFDSEAGLLKGNKMAERVEVYWNLHKHCFSVRALDGPNKGRVIEHTDKIAMLLPTFVVQAAGRAKVLRERKKNVHAFVRGLRVHNTTMVTNITASCWQRASYNPYKHATWVDQAGNELTNAAYCLLTAIDSKPTVMYDNED